MPPLSQSHSEVIKFDEIGAPPFACSNLWKGILNHQLEISLPRWDNGATKGNASKGVDRSLVHPFVNRLVRDTIHPLDGLLELWFGGFSLGNPYACVSILASPWTPFVHWVF
jgi:hypothetical protein